MKLNLIGCIVAVILILGLSGCRGKYSGHDYTAEDLIKAKKAYDKAKKVYNTTLEISTEIKKEKERVKVEGFVVNPSSTSGSF